MADKTLIGGLFLVIITVVQCGELCVKESYDWFDTERTTFYCEEGCCGDLDDRHCCVSSTVGMIIGIVFGVCALAGIIATIVVCICCCKRTQSRPGMVMANQPVTTTATTTVVAGGQAYPVTTAQMGYTPSYPQMAPQPMAGTQPYGQPPMAGTQPYGQPPMAGTQPYGQPQAFGTQPQYAAAPPAYDDVTQQKQ